MKLTLVTKTLGTQTIETENAWSEITTGSTFFRAVEVLFDRWYEKHTAPGAPMGRDIIGMYEGEADQPAIYTKRGAIWGALEALLEQIEESPRTKITSRDLEAFDLEATFH